MFFNTELTVWENLNKTIMYLNILCIFLLIVLIIGCLTARTKERKIEIEKFNLVGVIVAMIVIILSSLMQPIIRENINTPVEGAINEKKKINTYSQYTSPTSKEDCCLCSDNSNELLSFYWGEHNLAVLDLNTFDFFRLEINRYDDNKNLIEEKIGYMQMGGKTLQNGETLYFNTDVDRGSASGTITLNENSKLSLDSLSTYLCSNCLTEVMNQYSHKGDYWNIALLNLENKTINPIEESVTGFGMNDFSVKYRYNKANDKIDLLVWYSPIRYK